MKNRTAFIVACLVFVIRGSSSLAGEPAVLVSQSDATFRGITKSLGTSHDGKQVPIYSWLPGKSPVVDSSPLLPDWSDVGSVDFWMRLEEPFNSDMQLVLLGLQPGYFSASVPLDFTGWKKISIPIEQFAPRNHPGEREVSLQDIYSLGFRAKGYGQTSIPAKTLWEIDDLELTAKPGKTFPRDGEAIAANRKMWEELSAAGNPIYEMNHRRFHPTQAAFVPPADVTNSWQFRNVAEALLLEAFEAGNPESPNFGRKDLVEHAIGAVDWIIAGCNPEGWWWKGTQSNANGDPNINRFVAGPLLDSVNWLIKTPEGKAAWPRWQAKLKSAVDLQKQISQGQIAWDKSNTGHYPNQDVYYMLIMALSAELFNQPADRAAAGEMMQKVAANLLPDGGLHYIGVENEVPIYHMLNLVIIARYATITGDQVALDLIRKTVHYCPLTLSAEGFPESWSDIWWKHGWIDVGLQGLVVAAGVTKDPRNQGLLWNALGHRTPTTAQMMDIYAAPYWPGIERGQALPENFLVADRNIRGIHGRSGAWYFGMTQGRGLRDTYVGGMITDPHKISPLVAAFRGAQIEVAANEVAGKHGLWLSSSTKDSTALAWRPNSVAVLGARYRLQPSIIHGTDENSDRSSVWQVTQVWRAAGDGMIGQVTVEATDNASPASASVVLARIALGPGPVKPQGNGTWNCGPLVVKLLRSFGKSDVEAVAGFTPRSDGEWDGVVIRRALRGGAKRGDSFTYAVWIGPDGTSPPTAFATLPNGWAATLSDGQKVVCLFNTAASPVPIGFPWNGAGLPVGYDEQGKTVDVTRKNGQAVITLKAGAAILIE